MDSKAIKQERSQPIGEEREGKKEGTKHRFWSVVKDKAKEFEMTVLAGGFQSVLKLFARTFKNFENEVKEAFKRQDSERCNAILEQVRMINKIIMWENFKKNITTSEISKDGSLAFELLYDSSLIDLSCNIVKEEQEEDIKEIPNPTFIIPKTTLDKHTQIQNDISKEMAENHSKTLKQTELKFQEQIHKLNEDIKSLREQKEKSDNLVFEFRSNISDKETQTITEKELKTVIEQLSALKLKYQHLQAQNKDLQLKLKMEHQLVKKTKKDLQELLWESIYKGNVQNKRLFDSNFTFERSFINNTHKDQINAFIRNNLKLPKIKSIKIFDIENSQLENINKFLQKSFPNSLQFLRLNRRGSEIFEGAKIIKGLVNSLPRVTREVYLVSFEFQSSELEAIIQNSRNASRLIFTYCKLHTKQNMCFGITKTNITYLSFVCCGWDSTVWMEWSAYPERFKHIVEAISNSSLRNTLQTLNIHCCRITKSKVEKMMKVHGLGNVEVVRNNNYPLSY